MFMFTLFGKWLLHVFLYIAVSFSVLILLVESIHIYKQLLQQLP